MNYDAVLIMVPPWEPRMPPLGLAYVAEYLKSRGFKIKVLDFNLRLYREACAENRFFWQICNINSMPPDEITAKIFDRFRNKIEILVDEVTSSGCDIIGFSVNIASIGLAGRIASLIKAKDRHKRIIFGGTGCYWSHDRHLVWPQDRHSIDAFVVGEGEEPLERIINNYRNNKSFEDIKGVIHKKEDFLKPGSAFFTRDIDRLPFPTFSDFELNLYKQRLVPVLISRGCIGRCVFCIDRLICGNYRFRSPEKIIQELKYHLEINKISHFAFNDLICNGNLKQLEEVCQLIIQSGLNITWGSYAMVRKDMDAGLLKKMKKSGCIWLCYGVESGSDRTLKRMNKFYNSQDAQRVIRATHEAGMLAAVNIIVGFPGEKDEDFTQTLSFIKRNKQYISEITNVSSFVIMQGSRMGRNLREYGVKLSSLKKGLDFYVDDNGLDLRGRLKRVRRTIFTVANLGIRNVIVNQPGLKDYRAKKTMSLIFCPPARTDLLPLRLAALSSVLRRNKQALYDFNIALYQLSAQKLKYLWDSQNWHLWSFAKELEGIFNCLEEELFRLCEDLLLPETNKFCFLISKENLIFSLKISSMLKKYNPNNFIIFSGSILEREAIYELIPAGSVDILIFKDEQRALLKILNNKGDYRAQPNIAVYKDGRYLKPAGRMIESKQEKRINGFIDFGRFNLKAYNSDKLPLSLEIS